MKADMLARREYDAAMSDTCLFVQAIYETLATTPRPTDITWDDVEEAREAKKTLRDLYSKMIGTGKCAA